LKNQGQDLPIWEAASFIGNAVAEREACQSEIKFFAAINQPLILAEGLSQPKSILAGNSRKRRQHLIQGPAWTD
jgi:hypothetical protein